MPAKRRSPASHELPREPHLNKDDGIKPLDIKGVLRRFFEWISMNSLAFVGIIGLLWYAALRVTLVLFYRPLGIRPEDVGLGYVELLSRSVFLIPIALFYGLIAAPSAVPEKREKQRSLRWTVARWLAIPILVLGGLSARAWEDGSSAASGTPSNSWLYIYRALPARVFWTADHSVSAPIDDGDCVLFLGDHDGVTLIYEPTSKSTIRVSSQDIVVQTGGSLSRVKRVPHC